VNIEDQLASISHKNDLLKRIAKLPEGSKGILVVEEPDSPDNDVCTMHYLRIGEATNAEALYYAKSFEHLLFDRHDHNDQEG
jgi:hypothetical protein